MAKAKLNCENIRCKHNSEKKCMSKKTITIGAKFFKGCDGFEKGFHYYFNLVWNALDTTNMIQYPDLTKDLRIGLYYVMEIYHLGMCERGHGYWKFMTLYDIDDETNSALKYEDIIKKDTNMEKLNYHYDKFINGILPPYEDLKQDKVEAKVDFQPYGYLSPDGNFIEGDWGDHEALAWEIIKENNWSDSFEEENKKEEINYAKLFLINKKGYCLIHDPYNVDYMVVNKDPLTEKQTEFLYNYFMDMGNVSAASEYKSS